MKSLILAVLTAVTAHHSASAGQVTRGCKAIWEIRAGDHVQQFGAFEARATCRSRVRASECRLAARIFARACFKDVWSAHMDFDAAQIRVPQTCVGSGETGVRNFPLAAVDDVGDAINRHACDMPFATPFEVTVVGKTFDGRRCLGEVMLSETYVIRDEMCGQVE